MYLKLEQLNKLYLKRKKEFPDKYKYNDLEVIDNYSIDINVYDMNVRYIYADDMYQIYVFIGMDDKLIFHGLYKEDSYKLDSEYKNLKKDISTLSVDKFVDKYYELLQKNFY